MKQIKINLYKYSELTDKAKQRAYNDWLNNSHWDFYDDEFRDTLKEFEELAGIRVFDWQINECSKFYRYKVLKDTDNLEGKRLYAWVINNFWDILFEYRTKDLKSKKRYVSRVKPELRSCPLTGVYTDMAVLKPIIKYIDKPDFNLAFEDLIEDCLDSFFTEFQDDYAYNYFFECFNETREELWDEEAFLETGELFNY